MHKAGGGRSAWVCGVFAALVAIAGAIVLPAAAGASSNDGYTPAGVNGHETSIAKWPYLVGVLAKDEHRTFYAQFCGGSVVAPTIVLSAAHCTFDGNGNPVSANAVDVLVGADTLTTRWSTTVGDRVAVTNIIRDPAYNPNTLQHDFALFVLASPANVTPVQVVPPTSDYRWAAGHAARVAGFGCTQYDLDPGSCTQSGYPTKLHETALPMVADRACENYGGIYTQLFRPTTMVCAGTFGDVVLPRTGLEVGTAPSACFGDSGGPLVVEGPNGVDYQVGVVSWGPGSCGLGPGVYSRLGTGPTRDWLR